MNRVAIALTLCAVAVLPLHAQRMGSAGGFRGGFAGRPAGGFGRVATMPRPGFGMRGVPFAGLPPGTRVTQIPGRFGRFGHGLPPGTRVAQFPGRFRFGFGFGFRHHRFPFFNERFCLTDPVSCGRFRFFSALGFNPFFSSFGGFPWWGGGWGWGGYGGYPYFGYDSSGYDSSAAQTAAMTNQQTLQSMQDEINRLREEQAMARDEQAQRTAPAPQPTPQAAKPEPERPATVLVFRDQRRIEVHNYAIAGNTLYNFDPSVTHKITLAELDVPATIAANEQRGVEFHVPPESGVRK